MQTAVPMTHTIPTRSGCLRIDPAEHQRAENGHKASKAGGNALQLPLPVAVDGVRLQRSQRGQADTAEREQWDCHENDPTRLRKGKDEQSECLAENAEEQCFALADPSDHRANGKRLHKGDECAEHGKRKADLGRGPAEAILDKDDPDGAVGLADEADQQECREQRDQRGDRERPAPRGERVQCPPVDRPPAGSMRLGQNEDRKQQVDAVQHGGSKEGGRGDMSPSTPPMTGPTTKPAPKNAWNIPKRRARSSSGVMSAI